MRFALLREREGKQAHPDQVQHRAWLRRLAQGFMQKLFGETAALRLDLCEHRDVCGDGARIFRREASQKRSDRFNAINAATG